jgi:hypothetical protein
MWHIKIAAALWAFARIWRISLPLILCMIGSGMVSMSSVSSHRIYNRYLKRGWDVSVRKKDRDHYFRKAVTMGVKVGDKFLGLVKDTLVAKAKNVIQFGAENGLSTTLTAGECTALTLYIEEIENQVNGWVSVDDIFTPNVGDTVKMQNPDTGEVKKGWWNNGFFFKENGKVVRLENVKFWKPA